MRVALGAPSVSTEEAAGETLLVVVLKEIEHMLEAFVAVLHPFGGDTFGGPSLTENTAEVVVHAHFVVEVVESRSDVCVVLVRVVTLANKEEFLMSLPNGSNRPSEELDRYHLRHINPHTVDTFVRPEEQDVAHLDPGRWDRVELLLVAALIEDAVVQFDGLIPVVEGGMRSETIITGDLGGVFFVALQVLVHRESFARQVVEVIERGECPFGVVFLSEILYASGLTEGFILAADVVGNKVDKDI